MPDPKLMAETLQSFVDAWGEAVDNDHAINGGDAVDFLVSFLSDARRALEE